MNQNSGLKTMYILKPTYIIHIVKNYIKIYTGKCKICICTSISIVYICRLSRQYYTYTDTINTTISTYAHIMCMSTNIVLIAEYL